MDACKPMACDSADLNPANPANEQSEVFDELDSVHHTVCRLEDVLAQLFTRLDVVIKPDYPVATDDQKAKEASCELVGRISSINDRIQVNLDMLANRLERLAL